MIRPLASVLRSGRRFCVDRPALKRRVKRLGYAGIRSLGQVLGPTLDDRPRLLGYHTVGDEEDDLSVSAVQFRAQLEWLLRHGFQIRTLRQWATDVREGRGVAPRTVILSFDDGFQSLRRRVAPVLAEYGLAATVFVVTDYVGTTNAFDRPFLQGPELPLASWEELEALQRLGWDIQAHGRRHRPMVQLDPGALEEEVVGSKLILERRLGSPVDFFCYPYGAFDLAAVEAIRRAGYLGAVTCRSGVLPQRPEGDWFRLPRTLVDGLVSLGHFSTVFRRGFLRLSAAERWLRGRAGAQECPFDELDKLEQVPVMSGQAPARPSEAAPV